MAYDKALADRVREVVQGRDVRELKMFGGLTFMVAGKMACGVVGDALMVRVGPDAYEDALARPHARPMDFTGRPMKGLVYVDPPGIAAKRDLEVWVGRGVAFAES